MEGLQHKKLTQKNGYSEDFILQLQMVADDSCHLKTATVKYLLLLSLIIYSIFYFKVKSVSFPPHALQPNQAAYIGVENHPKLPVSAGI